VTQLDRYILKQILAPTALAFFLIAFLAVSNEIRERGDLLLGEILEFRDLARLAVYFLPTLLSFVVPIAFLFGILMGLGQLVARGEIGAIQSAGIPLSRLIAPVVATGAVLAVTCLVVQDRLQPWAIHEAYDLIERELPERATIDMLQPGVMHEYEGWRVYFAYRDPATQVLYDVDIVRPDDEGGAWVFHAETATLRELGDARVLELAKGHWVSPKNLRSTFDSQELDLPARAQSPSARRLRLGMNLAELFESEKRRTEDYQNSGSYSLRIELLKERQEIAERLSLPFAALAVSFTAAPLALWGRRGRRGARTQLFSSGLGILLLYYLLLAAMEPRSLHDLDDYLLRLWIPNLALIGFGVFLIWRVDRVGPIVPSLDA